MKVWWILGLIELVVLQACWGARAKMTIHVEDDFGNVIEGVPIQLRTFVKGHAWEYDKGDEYRYVDGETDENGNATLCISSKWGTVNYYLDYSDRDYFSEALPVTYTEAIGEPVQYNLRNYWHGGGGAIDFKEKEFGKWLPWNPTLNIVLKPIVDPVKMYFKSIDDEMFIPSADYGKEIGFDLIECDWVAPYGKGEISDFIFNVGHREYGSRGIYGAYFETNLFLSFSNDGDGIQLYTVPAENTSSLEFPRMAPESGYESKWERKQYQAPGAAFIPGREESDKYMFRVRTVKNEAGEIVSALYGKIDSPISFGVFQAYSRAEIRFRYYLNGDPTSRSLEFGGNLFKE